MFKQIIEKYKSASDLNRFLIKGVTFYLVWRIFRKWMLLKGQYSGITQLGAVVYLKTSRFILSVFNVETVVDLEERKLWITGSEQAIEIVYDCLGINLFFVFFIFILAYPGKIKTKLWFIPAGLVLIFLMNSLRMAALTVIAYRIPLQMDFYHHFLFQGLIYAGIFLLWLLFIKVERKKQ